MKITAADIKNTNNRQVWALGNQSLYDLCRKNPRHTKDDVIIAKIMLIGRVYAAAIERRKPDKQKSVEALGDNFYTKVVAPKVRKSGIDVWLNSLPPHLPSLADVPAINQILTVHSQVTNLFFEISGLEKRSLASKYLHFHRPDLFFIYDSRSNSGIKSVTPSLKVEVLRFPDQDTEYVKFFCRCLWLCDDIKLRISIQLTPRQLDDLLINLAERKN